MRIWFPYVATLFVFIWTMNLIGFIPLPFGERHFACSASASPSSRSTPPPPTCR